MDHDGHDHAVVDGPWSGGWMVAGVAGLIAAVLARVLGEVGFAAALMLGGMVFAVFGVLLGSGGVELTAGDADADHGSGHS